MSVVGFDFGNMNSVIAVARNRGVDVICNEVSNRATPTLISFGPRNRFIGEAAKTQEVGNFRNTTFGVKRLLGATLRDRDVVEHETRFLSCELVEKDGHVAQMVNYLGEERVFTSVELAAMLLARLRQTTEADVGRAVADVVIAVPVYFTDRQRRVMLDAAEIAGLRCLRTINETTAAALAYGMPRLDLPETDPRIVCFVDIGQASTSVSIAGFTRARLDIRAVAFDRCLGGRDFDDALAQHMCDELLRSRGMDVRANKKALFRLRAAAERTKRVLSANAVTRLSVEALMDDVDISVDVARGTFEGLVQGLLARIQGVVTDALQRAGVTAEQVHAVEIVGGSTRIPAVKALLAGMFGGREASTTLNQDEAVARGAALQCAIISPVFKVREYAVHDTVAFPVQFRWSPTEDQPDDSECVVFPVGNAIPSTKLLSFERPLPFDVECRYAEVDRLPSTEHAIIGRAVIGSTATGSMDVKVKVRASPNGLTSVEGAQTVERVESTATAADGAEQAKVSERKTDVPITWTVAGLLSRGRVQEMRDAESEMSFRDHLVAETTDRRNALEEYIYEMRSKLEDAYAEFISKEDAGKLAAMMNETEEWLYGDGSDATKGVYIARLESLQAIGQPVKERARDSEERPKAEQRLRDFIGETREALSKPDGPFAFAEDADKEKLRSECQQKLQWIDAQVQAQKKLSRHVPPVLTVAAIEKQLEAFRTLANTVQSKASRAQAAALKKAQDEAKSAAKEASACASPANAMNDEQSHCHTGCCPSEEIPEMQVD